MASKRIATFVPAPAGILLTLLGGMVIGACGSNAGGRSPAPSLLRSRNGVRLFSSSRPLDLARPQRDGVPTRRRFEPASGEQDPTAPPAGYAVRSDARQPSVHVVDPERRSTKWATNTLSSRESPWGSAQGAWLPRPCRVRAAPPPRGPRSRGGGACAADECSQFPFASVQSRRPGSGRTPPLPAA